MAKRGRKRRSKNGRRGRKPGPKPGKAAAKKRGRRPIFTPAQVRVLNRLICVALKDQFRRVARGL